jgi:hypothetical protein
LTFDVKFNIIVYDVINKQSKEEAVMAAKKSRKERLISTIKGLQALAARNGKQNAFIPLKTIYKVQKADTVGKKADIRGILNRDFLNGEKTFERQQVDGKKRSGAYRLQVAQVNLNDVESAPVDENVA